MKDIGSEDSGVIFYQFLEILRHNVVSDKANAFNKIFNLFLCKVYDEDRNEEEQLEFQWKYNDTNESLLGRLNTLFKLGMKKFLNKNITDYSEEDIEKKVSSKEVQNILKELRLYKNQEFAFLEVFDRDSFNENAEIVREIVELLQPYRIRYSDKQQFLGNFFERLLNTGFKQESGQYFTPIPLTRFILNSLPIEDIMREKIQNQDEDFLPYLIDYACGSGHFLTEAMDIIQEKLNNLVSEGLRPTQKKNLDKYKDFKYDWAEKYIYGIEKDYRLVKTAKLSCFLNGDGLANIIHASGLAPFGSKNYQGKLGESEQFDILVANPPYSVKGFLKTVKEGRDSFELLKKGKITDKSSAIELLFVERMCQLIKPKGYAGIILPSSFLTNNDEATQFSRNLLLSYFEIQAISLFGSNAFMATGTNTIILFLKKYSKRVLLSSAKKEDYQSLFSKQEILITISGEKEKEKDFLGYEFSNAKDAKEPIKIGDSLMTNLKDQKDPTKASYYIYQWILTHEKKSIPEELKESLYYKKLDTCFNFDQETFSNSLNIKKKISLQSKWNLVALESICKIGKGKTITKEKSIEGTIPVIAGGQEYAYLHNKFNINEPVITVSASGAYSGFVSFHDYPIWASDCITILNVREDFSKIEYIFYSLKHLQKVIYSLQKGNAQPHVYPDDLKKFLLPLPPLEEQEKIVLLMREQEKIIQESSSQKLIQQAQEKQKQIMSEVFQIVKED